VCQKNNPDALAFRQLTFNISGAWPLGALDCNDPQHQAANKVFRMLLKLFFGMCVDQSDSNIAGFGPLKSKREKI
jgi:hypothetical protein